MRVKSEQCSRDSNSRGAMVVAAILVAVLVVEVAAASAAAAVVARAEVWQWPGHPRRHLCGSSIRSNSVGRGSGIRNNSIECVATAAAVAGASTVASTVTAVIQ